MELPPPISETVPLLLPLPPPPPPGLIDLAPPPIFEGSYTLHHERKHLALINGESEFVSSKDEVENKCKKQLEAAEKSATETESTGEKELRNLEICTRCEKCGHWIENEEMKSHRSFHAAHIVEGLLLGDKVCSMSKKELLERNQVTHIVNAAIELKNYFEEEGVKYVNLQLYDDFQEEVISEAVRAAHFIKAAKDEGGVVFVHCAMGKSRSVSAIIMYLMLFHHLDYQQSLALVRVNRPIAKPNLSYERQLKQYYQNNLKPEK